MAFILIFSTEILLALIGFDKATMFLQQILTFFFFFYLRRACLETKIYVLKQSWIRHITLMADRTWQAIPNYWKLESCSRIWSHWGIFYLRVNGKWSCLLALFCVGCYFNVWLNLQKEKNNRELVCFFPSFSRFFLPRLCSPCVISHLSDTLCSPSKRTYAHIASSTLARTHTYIRALNTSSHAHI